MTPLQPNAQQIIELFDRARAVPAGADRQQFLQAMCGNDAALHAELASLLSEHESVGDFLRPTPLDPQSIIITEKPGDRIGNYVLIEKIGEGGCGVVYMAQQEQPVRRRVALKIIKVGMDTRQVVARFEAERQALALMEHSNIAKVFDAGATETGRPYFVMELVRGVKITEYCDDHKLGIEERLILLTRVCEAIQHAHQKGIIHRDIKPSNVLVTVDGGGAVPKVIDFGIAKATEQPLSEKTVFTAFEQFVGTPAYMSPEQAQLTSAEIDTRTDIYSLGVLLYELLTGKPPFDSRDLAVAGVQEIRRIIGERDPPKPSTRLSTLDAADLRVVAASRNTDAPRLPVRVRGDLDWIVMKSLEKDRTRRYATANSLAADLMRHLSHEPITARPPSRSYRFQKMVRRNRLAFAAVAIFAASLVFAAIGSTAAAWRIAAARRAEREERQKTERANRQVRDANARLAHTVSLLELQRAEDAFRVNDSPAGVAQLTAILRHESSNHIAANRLVSALIHRNWGLPVTAPMRHLDRVTAASFSPDGGRVLSASWDKTAEIWDAATGQPLATMRHQDSVLAASYDRAGDRCVTASADGTAAIWNARNGALLGPLLRHDGKVYTAEFSGDGQSVVTASADQSARIWDAASGALKQELRDDNSEVLIAHFSPANDRVVVGTRSGRIRICRVDTGRIVLRLDAHNGRINALAFSPDGRALASASEDGTVRLWDPTGGQPPTGGRLLAQSTTPYHAVAFSPDSRLLLATSRDGKALLWDSKTGYAMPRVFSHEADSVIFGAFSPDGQLIVTTSMDNSARLWDVRTGTAFCQPLRESEAILHAGFSPDGRRLVTASWDQTVQIWNIEPRRFVGIGMRHEQNAITVAFDPRGESVLSASFDGTARLWNARTGEALGEPMRHQRAVRSADYSADGDRIVTASEDGTACVWDSRTGQMITGPLQHAKTVWSAQFNPDGKRVVTASADGTARVWDSRTGQPTTPPLQHGGDVRAARFSPDGRWVVTASEDRSARVWNAQTGEPVTERLQHLDSVEWAEFSPDSQRVVSASSDNTARIWEARTGKPIGPPLQHLRTVTKAVFSPDGRRIATASLDRTARIWDADTGEALTPPLMHDSSVSQVCFSADGRRILTSCWDGVWRLWDADTGRPLTEWIAGGGLGFSACFDATGRRVGAAAGDGFVRAWDTPEVPTPVPPWFLALAEAVAGTRLSARGNVDWVPRRGIKDVAEQLARGGGSDFYQRLGRWFLADPAERPVSPF